MFDQLRNYIHSSGLPYQIFIRKSEARTWEFYLGAEFFTPIKQAYQNVLNLGFYLELAVVEVSDGQLTKVLDSHRR